MQRYYDLIIIGGGIVGLSAAVAMSSLGMKVALLDAKSLDNANTDANNRVYAVNQASRHLFEEIGVWDLMADSKKSPYERMCIWDATSQASIEFDSRLVHQSELGFILSDGLIRQALLKKIQALDSIECFDFTQVDDIRVQDQGVEVFAKDRCWQAAYLMIADGGESPARKKLNIPIRSWPYHQQALTATVQTENAHQKTAWQVFTSDGPLAFLPLADERECSIVWSTSAKHANALIDCDEPAFCQALEQAFEHRLGRVKLLNKGGRFPLIMRHAKQYAGDRWLLLGDAAHTIHPLAGLGLNLGLADVSCVMGYIRQAKSPQLSKKVLGQYQRDRKHAVWQSIGFVEGIKALFANPLPAVARLRGFGLQCTDRFNLLKRFFIEQASGL